MSSYYAPCFYRIGFVAIPSYTELSWCNQKEVFKKYWPFTLLRWQNGLHFCALYFWNSGLKFVTQMIVIHVTWLLSVGGQLEKFADKKTLLYMNVSTIKNLMWMNQFNTTIISLVIASLFQIFSFHNLTCNKRYAAFT